MDSLKRLLSRLRDACLTAKLSKCTIACHEIECLGHIVGVSGMSPNPDKVQAIQTAERPTTKGQVRSFLGLVGFYRRYIPNFSLIALPLTDITRKGQPNHVKWGDAQEKAFRTLKQVLLKEPILKLPNCAESFILQTDASKFGLGAILLQREGEVKLPVAYASRKLKGGDLNHSTIEKECLAIVWAVQKFCKYLYRKAFELETDDQPLVYLSSMKGTNSRLLRWALSLQPYRFTVIAIKGRDNVGADYLSRL